MKRLLIVLGFILVFALLASTGCTENQMAKNFGGTMKIDVPPGNKLINATWKDAELWYLYRPFETGETPTVITFQEKSQYGMNEGKVVFTEKELPKPK